MTQAVKQCPFCAEEINLDAIKCKYCKEFLNQPPHSNSRPITPHYGAPLTQLTQDDLVSCDSCKKTLRGQFTRSFFGYHQYTCAGCGYTTTYPLGSGYESLYSICAFLFIIWLFVFFFIDMSTGMGLLGLIGLIGVPVLIHNSSLKSRRHNYKVKEHNTTKP